jgi:uncharacterized protein YjaZ
MPVVRTDEWIENEQLTGICERLASYFENAAARGVYLHLLRHGMHSLAGESAEIVNDMKQNRIWERVESVYRALRARWNGPDVPVFIFPADAHNRKLARDFNSKGGLAYPDKLFLFLLPHHSPREIEALLTHEYNHVCRLAKTRKNEYTLLDALVLEGLAEQAVGKHVGPEHQAKWVAYYQPEQLRAFWKRYLAPHRSIPQSHSLHDRLLYGLGFYPPMLGYAVGYGIVAAALEQERDLLKLSERPSEQILELSQFDK